MNEGTKKIAQLGLLTALALILGYLESLFPLFPAMPGIKAGLSNCVLLYAVYLMKPRDAVLLMLLKVGLSALLFASPAAFFYSLAGGALSLAAMLLLHRLPGVSVPVLSVCGAMAHNIGQLCAAALLLGLRPALAYAPALLISSFATGALTGCLAKLVLDHIEKDSK